MIQNLKILIVDDEKPIRDMLRMALELAEFTVLEAADNQQAYRTIVDQSPHLILLDWMLPGGSGIELLRRLRKDDSCKHIPVIMLTAKAEEDNMIQGLDGGADDYITKPFAPKALIARINALLRRSGALADETLELGALRVDQTSHIVSVDHHPLTVGPTEYKLLVFFMSHKNRVFSRNQLLDQVWGTNVYLEERTVDVHIRRLRKALDAGEIGCGEFVQTVRGSGYRFSDSNS